MTVSYYGTTGGDYYGYLYDALYAQGYGGNDTLYGSYYYSYNDTLYGGDGNDYLYGYGGNDYLDGGYGNDYIDGGYGNDIMYGSYGNDTMYGGYGDDYYYVDSYYDSVNEYAYSGTDTVYSNLYSYTLGNYVENLTLGYGAYVGYGNSLDNKITGYDYSSYNYLYGYAGNDTLKGGYYNDYMDGGTGRDSLAGGYGNDTLVGGYGNDTLNGYGGGSTEVDYLYGGTGYYYEYNADTFVLGDQYGAYYKGNSSYATVSDYSYYEGDKVQLYGSSSNYYTASGYYGGSASYLDTAIYYYNSGTYSYDLVGIVNDATTISYSYA